MIDTAYLQPNTTIVCETVEEFKELLIELGALGYTWPNGKAASAELELDCSRYRNGDDAVWTHIGSRMNYVLNRANMLSKKMKITQRSCGSRKFSPKTRFRFKVSTT